VYTGERDNVPRKHEQWQNWYSSRISGRLFIVAATIGVGITFTDSVIYIKWLNEYAAAM